MQQHLILHNTEDTDSISESTYYEADGLSAYNFTQRQGKITEIVGARHGAAAAGVVSSLLEWGDARIRDLAVGYGVADVWPDTKTLQVIASRSNRVKSADHLAEILQTLLREGFIVPITKWNVKPTHDIEQEAERNVLARPRFHGGLHKKQDKEEYAHEVRQLLRAWRDETNFHSRELTTVITSARSRKRQRSPNLEYSRKRAKMYGISTNGVNGDIDDHDLATLPLEQKYVGLETVNNILRSRRCQILMKKHMKPRSPSEMQRCKGHFTERKMAVRVNFEKLNVLLRNQHLVDLVSERMGTTTAKVFEAILRLVEKNTPRCYDPLDMGTIDESVDKLTLQESTELPTGKILQSLEHDLDLSKGLPSNNTAQAINGLNGLHSEEAKAQDETDELEGLEHRLSNLNGPTDETLRQRQLETHLNLLANCSEHFLKSKGRSWIVPYGTLTPILIQEVILNHVSGIFGNIAARLIRILAWVGNLDEKSLCQRSLLSPKDVRPVLARLLKEEFVYVSVVARDAVRTTGKSANVYSYSVANARAKILENTYKTVCRLLQRAEREKEEIKVVIEKAERSDVKGNEDKYLTEAERDVLDKWYEKEELILGQVARCDDLIGVLRDFWPLNREITLLRTDDFGGETLMPEEVTGLEREDEDEDEDDAILSASEIEDAGEM
jgi:DNA-directed RNA polymerase III subunit RPC3